MHTTSTTQGGRARRGPLATSLVVLALVLPMTGLLGGTAFAAVTDGGSGANNSDKRAAEVDKKAAKKATEAAKKAAEAAKKAEEAAAVIDDQAAELVAQAASAIKAAGFIGPVAPSTSTAKAAKAGKGGKGGKGGKTDAATAATTATTATTVTTATTSGKAKSGKAKSGSCITYHFTYTNGLMDNGVFCGGNNVTRADVPGLHAVSLHISCSDTFAANGTALKSDLGGLLVKTWSIDKGNGKTCGSTPAVTVAPPTGGTTNPSTCTENSFLDAASPASGSTVKAGQVVSVVYSDETPLNNGQVIGRNGVTATAPVLLIDGNPASGLVQTPLSTGRDKFNVRLSFTVPSGLSTGTTHTFTVIAYDSDQNKKGGDCGVATWTLTVTPSTPTCPPAGCPQPCPVITGPTYGGDSSGMTPNCPTPCPAAGSVAPGAMPAGCPNPCPVITGATFGGDGTGMQPNCPLPCPAAGSVGPTPAGCPVTGTTGGPAQGPPPTVVGNTPTQPVALPFTGSNAVLLAGIALMMLLVGGVLTAVTRRPRPVRALI